MAIILLGQSCVPPEDESVNNILLAKVYDRPLYLSELEDMVPRSATPNDSSLIVNAYVNRWVKENVMLYEAERNVPKNLDIDKLVRDYRASLILHNYEKGVAESGLDSVITDEEYLQYFNDYKNYFQLETSVKRCKFIKLKTEDAAAKIEKWWKSDDAEDRTALELYCRDYAIVYQLEDSLWVTDHEIESDFPKSIRSSMKEGNNFIKEKDNFTYFVDVMEVQSKNGEPPLGYIKNQANNYILHQRKLELVENKKEELFQKAQNNGHVKFYN